MSEYDYDRGHMDGYNKGHQEGYAEALEDARSGTPNLRDQFAMAALPGLIAHASGECPHKAPEAAYAIADAMLAAREAGNE